jgi:hypothetical protein
MRAIADTLHSFTASKTRVALRCIAAVVLLTALAARNDAHASTDGPPPVQGDALAQMATEIVSQGAMVPFTWEQRVALVGMGVAGLHLGTSSGTSTHSDSGHALRSAAYRLALPLAGAALGSLVACDSLCDGQEITADPLVGAMAGALVAHALDRDTPPGHIGQRPRLQWTPMVSVGLGSYSIGVMGRF